MHSVGGFLSEVDDDDEPSERAQEYARLFPHVYLAFHRRDGKRRMLSGPSRAVLLHLTQTGPLTVSECAAHFDRAQSVISEILAQLEQQGLIARVRDSDDRRRTLVWLTELGRTRLIEEREVLSLPLLGRAFARMRPEDQDQLLRGTRALIEAALQNPTTSSEQPISTPKAKRRKKNV